ncbi:MAG: hypothetical protein ACYDGR_05200 [Candidatus Dormibacteria bacterium]
MKRDRKARPQSSQSGLAALEWVLLLVAVAGLVAILVIFYASSQPTHLAPMR